MRMLLGAVVILAFAGFAGAAGQGKDKDKDTVDLKKLMGKWEPKEGKITIEFADKGKMVVALDSNGKSEKFEGTYKVTGNKLEIAVTIMGKEQKESLTVKKLTDDELVTVDSKNMEDTLKKKK